MPLYQFEHPKTGEMRDVFFQINDNKVYLGEEGEVEVIWHRRFAIPNTSSNSKSLDPFSKDDFMRATKEKNMTFGDMWDESARLSQERVKRVGEDNVKETYYNEYAASRKGLKHLQDQRDAKEVAKLANPKASKQSGKAKAKIVSKGKTKS